jgi:release factor glutamine methyltransferase
MEPTLHTMRVPLDREIVTRQMVLRYDPRTVYEPAAYSSILLLRNLTVKPDDVALDLGTGTGVYSVGIAMRGAKRVVAVDISDDALNTTRCNAELNGVADRLELRQGSMFEPIRANEQFSLIVSNPPCLPDPGDADPTLPGATMMSGSDGSYHATLMLDEAPHFLSAGGRLVFVYPSTSNPHKIFNMLDAGYRYQIQAEIQVPFYLHFLELWPYLHHLRDQGVCDFYEIAGVPYRTYWLIEAQPRSH